MAEIAEMKEANKSYEAELNSYVNKEKAAVELMANVGNLMYGRSVELVLFRNHLVDRTVAEMMNLHEYAANVVNKPINVFDSAALATEMLEMDLAPSKIDIGRLTHEWQAQSGNYENKRSFLEDKLADFIGVDSWSGEPKDVVLYGFGRIGRLCARELVKQFGKGQQLRLRAIVTRKAGASEMEKRAALLRNDSVHGAFNGSVDVDVERQALIINGQTVHT